MVKLIFKSFSVHNTQIPHSRPLLLNYKTASAKGGVGCLRPSTSTSPKLKAGSEYGWTGEYTAIKGVLSPHKKGEDHLIWGTSTGLLSYLTK